jgi:hypothetical protein
MDDFKANNRLFEEVPQLFVGPDFGGDLKRMGIPSLNSSDPTVP